MIHGDLFISAVMVHHIKPPKPAMAWFSQSESVSEKSCASAVWTGEKWLNLSPADLTCGYCIWHPGSFGDDLLKLFCVGMGGITTFISGPMVLFGGKLSYSTRTFGPWLPLMLASTLGWCSFSLGYRWILQHGTLTLSSRHCSCPGFTPVPSLS